LILARTELKDPIVEIGNPKTQDKTDQKPITKADKTAQNRHFVTEKKLAQQT
jgi:hypothetical protein